MNSTIMSQTDRKRAGEKKKDNTSHLFPWQTRARKFKKFTAWKGKERKNKTKQKQNNENKFYKMNTERKVDEE